jgi:hypothetical protein
MIYVALGVVVVHLGDELLRDVLLKAHVKSGALQKLDSVQKGFSLYRSAGPVVRKLGGSVVGAPGLYNWVFVFSLIDTLFAFHYSKLLFFVLWGCVGLLKFSVRLRRIVRTAFKEETLVSVP